MGAAGSVGVREMVGKALRIFSLIAVLLSSFFVFSGVVDSSYKQARLLFGDGCGQILEPEKLARYETITDYIFLGMLIFILIALLALFWSRVKYVVLLLLVTLVAALAFMAYPSIANPEALLRCDVFFMSPRSHINLSFVAAVLLATSTAISIWPFKDVNSGPAFDTKQNVENP